MPVWCGLYFQNAVSPVMEQLIFFHDHSMFVLILIMFVVGYLLVNSIFSLYYNLGLFEGQELESFWTILPAVFLVMIAFPSLRVLYLMEELENPELTLKILGHQWFWSYEYSDFINKSYDSYMMKNSKVLFRLLEVDNMLVVPKAVNLRLIISSLDVIHSWTIPALGVKADAIPGRANQVSFVFNRVGVFVGQCSEICGVNHSFMPIFMMVVPRSIFLSMWLYSGRVGISLLN